MKLIAKELKLATSPLSWLFLAFACMTLLPGYPITLGAFFVCLGLFQSAQLAREANDILYTVLLPIPKRDAVTAKYLVTLFFQAIAYIVMILLAVVRLTVLRSGAAYVANALLAANLTFLGFAALVFGLYNIMFLGGFFRTAYNFGKPFVVFIIVTMLAVGVAEALPHIPGLAFLGGTEAPDLMKQVPVLIAGLLVWIAGSVISLKVSQKRFEKIDL